MVNTLAYLYGEDAVQVQKFRINKNIEAFRRLYGDRGEIRIFSAPGRTEIGGNHTDHNKGRVLAAAVDLDIAAVVRPESGNVIRIKSAGFDEDVVDISDLSVKQEEKNTSAALIRGVAAGFVKNGHKVCGFTAYTTSNVLKGSGLSSSAAFEVLVGTILSALANDDSVSPVEIAKIAQYAENEYFGKPSGLMDQMASSVGGSVTIDFADTDKPVIESIPFDLKGIDLCIVDTKADHADLTPEYAAIPAEMKSVAAYFGQEVLRGITKKQIFENIQALRESCGDRAVSRALHFIDENERVTGEADALKNGDNQRFLDLVNESGESSYKYLQNIFALSDPRSQAMVIALYSAKDILGDKGAVRVHGGGFAGTIQAFVPCSETDDFVDRMESIFGDKTCYRLRIRPVGGSEIDVKEII